MFDQKRSSQHQGVSFCLWVQDVRCFFPSTKIVTTHRQRDSNEEEVYYIKTLLTN